MDLDGIPVDTGSLCKVSGEPFSQYALGITVPVLEGEAVHEYVLTVQKTAVLVEAAGLDIANST